MSTEPLLGHRTADARIAARAGAAIGAGRLLADASGLAQQLPPARHVLIACRDRYRFAVAFCASLIAGRTSLLPPSRTPDVLAQLARRYADTLYLGDDDGCIGWRHTVTTSAACTTIAAPAESALRWPPPAIARDQVAAIAFTSGSTGEPQPQPKTWGGMVDGARAEVGALRLDESAVEDVVLVGTVSPQHMFGLESTVLLALHGPCAFAVEHPLHPDEIAAVLARTEGRRVLISAPVHLRAMIESGYAMPALDRVVSATAPLAKALAARCESAWNTRVFEIYGCTETGMVASRRTVDGPLWTAMRDVQIEQQGEAFFARGGHVQAGRLGDRLRLCSATTFELGERTEDMVNVGGKRASLEGLNHLLLSIDGVVDGVFICPTETDLPANGREQRLMALAVAPHHTRDQLLAALRTQMDAAFLPRPLLLVDALPRNAQGKLPRAELLALAREALRASAVRGVVPADHPMLPGHFPGDPIVPGAWLLAWIVDEASHRLHAWGDARTLAGIKRVKFLRPLAPDQRFECAFRAGADTLRFTLTSFGHVIAEGSLQLQA